MTTYTLNGRSSIHSLRRTYITYAAKCFVCAVHKWASSSVQREHEIHLWRTSLNSKSNYFASWPSCRWRIINTHTHREIDRYFIIRLNLSGGMWTQITFTCKPIVQAFLDFISIFWRTKQKNVSVSYHQVFGFCSSFRHYIFICASKMFETAECWMFAQRMISKNEAKCCRLNLEKFTSTNCVFFYRKWGWNACK